MKAQGSLSTCFSQAVIVNGGDFKYVFLPWQALLTYNAVMF